MNVVHYALWDKRFIDTNLRLGGIVLKPETECGIVGVLPEGHTAETFDHISMFDEGDPRRPIVTCDACIKARDIAIARVEAMMKKWCRPNQ